MDCSMPGLPSLTISPSFPQIHVSNANMPSVMPSRYLTLWCPLFLWPQSFPVSRTFPMIFTWSNCLHQVTKILELQIQHQSFQWKFRVDFPLDWLILSPCCPRDFQEYSPAPQFEGINSLVLCLLYSLALTIVRDYAILFSHKRELFWVSSSEVDESGACIIEWSKSEKNKYCVLMHIYRI